MAAMTSKVDWALSWGMAVSEGIRVSVGVGVIVGGVGVLVDGAAGGADTCVSALGAGMQAVRMRRAIRMASRRGFIALIIDEIQ
jgi:hypothetical protein